MISFKFRLYSSLALDCRCRRTKMTQLAPDTEAAEGTPASLATSATRPTPMSPPGGPHVPQGTELGVHRQRGWFNRGRERSFTRRINVHLRTVLVFYMATPRASPTWSPSHPSLHWFAQNVATAGAHCGSLLLGRTAARMRLPEPDRIFSRQADGERAKRERAANNACL